jgi:hypothetical protein
MELPNPALEMALEAARLLGRWGLVAQRHGGGCSCCPGLGDIDMAQVEAKLLEVLRKQHPLLERRASFTDVLRDCVRRTPLDEEPAAVKALLRDFDLVLGDLEDIQRGLR